MDLPHCSPIWFAWADVVEASSEAFTMGKCLVRLPEMTCWGHVN